MVLVLLNHADELRLGDIFAFCLLCPHIVVVVFLIILLIQLINKVLGSSLVSNSTLPIRLKMSTIWRCLSDCEGGEKALIGVTLFPGSPDDLGRLFRDFKSISCALQQLHRVDIHLAQRLHATNVFEHVHADGEPCRRKSLFLGVRVDYWHIHVRNEEESRADGQVMHVDVVLLGVRDHYVVPFH